MADRFPRPEPRRVTEFRARARGRDVELHMDGVRMAMPQDAAVALARAIIAACSEESEHKPDEPHPDGEQSSAHGPSGGKAND